MGVRGQDHDTAAFAVEAIRCWYRHTGRDAYPDAGRLLISADGGGSNGYRLRAWKTELPSLAQETGLAITVCHLPTSKWNKIEHRLFSHISMNWRGRPLTSHHVIVDPIGATTTRSGLKFHADSTSAPTPPASGSPTTRWPPCPSAATTSTANGTTPSTPAPRP